MCLQIMEYKNRPFKVFSETVCLLEQVNKLIGLVTPHFGQGKITLNMVSKDCWANNKRLSYKSDLSFLILNARELMGAL